MIGRAIQPRRRGKAKVKSLSDKGLAQHKAGDHKASVKTLAEAMRMLVGGMK